MTAGWLQRLRGLVLDFLRENLLAKLATLMLALAVWGWIQSEQETEVNVWARVEYTLPERLGPSAAPVRRVRVRLAGTRAATRDLGASELSMKLDLSDLGPGTQEIELSESALEGLPANVRVVGLAPNTLQMVLEPLVTRKVKLDHVVSGSPAEGFRVAHVRLVPGELRVRGPASRMDQLKSLSTSAIAVDGLRDDTRVPVEVNLEEGVFRLEEAGTVVAEVDLEQVVESRTFAEIPVVVRDRTWRSTVTEASVTLEGPAAALQAIEADTVTVMIIVAPGAEGEVVAKVNGRVARVEVVHGGGKEVRVARVEPAEIPLVAP